MAPTEKAADPSDSPAVKQYTLVSMIGMLVMLVALWDTGLGIWSLVPILFGLAAMIFRWGIGPPVTLLCLVILSVMVRPMSRESVYLLLILKYPHFPFDVPNSFLSELLLGTGFLIYAAGHYRQLSLVQGIFPPDRRNPGIYGEPMPKPPTRATDLALPREIIGFALVMPLFAVGAFLLWEVVGRFESPEGMSREAWRILLLIWITACILFIVSAIVGYMGLIRQDPKAAKIYLQDQVWRETRREQARINHWLHSARLYRRRKKDGMVEKPEGKSALGSLASSVLRIGSALVAISIGAGLVREFGFFGIIVVMVLLGGVYLLVRFWQYLQQHKQEAK